MAVFSFLLIYMRMFDVCTTLGLIHQMLVSNVNIMFVSMFV